ncbi:hypothetical protein [Microcoleus sp. CAWBG640]
MTKAWAIENVLTVVVVAIQVAIAQSLLPFPNLRVNQILQGDI